jgi:hypothetical protein
MKGRKGVRGKSYIIECFYYRCFPGGRFFTLEGYKVKFSREYHPNSSVLD